MISFISSLLPMEMKLKSLPSPEGRGLVKVAWKRLLYLQRCHKKDGGELSPSSFL